MKTVFKEPAKYGAETAAAQAAPTISRAPPPDVILEYCASRHPIIAEIVQVFTRARWHLQRIYTTVVVTLR